MPTPRLGGAFLALTRRRWSQSGSFLSGLAARSSTELVAFVQAAREHFESEESILLLSGFPELHEHRHYHLSLIRRAEDLTTICDAEENPINSGECYDEIISFLLDD